jgi:hypothetical protein
MPLVPYGQMILLTFFDKSNFFGKRCALGYSYFGKRWVGNTLKLQQSRGFELDMQESSITAASDREGVQGKVGRENSETSTVTGIRARHARIGRHCCF